MTFVATGAAFEYQGILTEFIAEFADFKFLRHR
jgi:hypothetical protein